MKKIKKVLVVIVGCVLAWSNLPYYYNNEKAEAYASCHVAKSYQPEIGDISVLPKNEMSHFGHIAIYDGKQWVSDFKQKTSIQEENIEAWGAIEYTALLTAGIGNMCGHHRLIGTLGLNH